MIGQETPEEEYERLLGELAALCERQGWGDPLSYARSKEILAAIKLGHRVAPTLSGADAIGPNGEEYEYKSTIGKRCKGSYTGISVQPTWKEQEKYLIEEKIGKYPKHYYNRFEGGKLAEAYEMDVKDVLKILLPKLKRKHGTTLNNKDPRLSADVTWKEVEKYGTKVI